jgi:peptidyl-prolyl cis-trans isomerase A (cyclophilin A)
MRVILLLIGLINAAWITEACAQKSPPSFKILFNTTKGNYIVEAYRNWSPLAVDRLYALVQSGYYQNNYIFRVEKDYVIQFGITDNVKTNFYWDKKSLPDEPVMQKHKKGIVAFARSGKNSRSAQLFVDMVDNPKLDTTMREQVHGYPPIGKVIKGFDVLMKLNGKYKKQILPLQDSVYLHGNKYLDINYPGLDKIIRAIIIR